MQNHCLLTLCIKLNSTMIGLIDILIANDSLLYQEDVILKQDHFGFLFVRHPFSRLVSAYRDKVLFNTWRSWPERVQKDFQKVGINTP